MLSGVDSETLAAIGQIGNIWSSGETPLLEAFLLA
jgi:hypothetical protein